MRVLFSKSRIVALSLLAAVGATFAPNVMAQAYYNPAGALAGGLIGGAIGNSAFSGHNRNDRAAATAGLAVVGAMIGGQAGAYQPQPYYNSQPYYSQPSYGAPVYYSEAPVVYSRPRVIYAEPVYYGYGGPYYYESRHHHRRHR